MKYFWIGILVIITFSSCEDDTTFELNSDGLLGKWELYQYQENTGGGDYRTLYEPSGKTITFLPNGKLVSVDYFRCDEGEYQVVGQTLSIQFECEEEVPELTYYINKEDGNLVLSPRFPYMCIEGCAYFFKKIE